MSALPAPGPLGIAQRLKKLLLTSALVVGFSAYAAYQHFTAPPEAPANSSPAAGRASLPNPTPTAKPGVSAGLATPPPATATHAPTAANPAPTRTPLPARPTATPTATPVPAQAAGAYGAYKDGTYAGDSKNAYWGNVQVKAVIQGGQLTAVQVVDYPHDRRTSQQINNIALPDLQDEVIQAQSATVDIIGGATLTSRAYLASLQSALTRAKS